MTLFQNVILFTNHYGNLQEMLEMASFLRYAGLYLTSEWGRFYVGHSVKSKVFVRVTEDARMGRKIIHATGW
jgi:hypothetical protein